MERRQQERFAVNLKAALIHEQAMPLGCRVRDVSNSGMLLQCERQEKAKSLRAGDNVEVRLSFRHGNDRKGIPLPTIVRRVEDNGIGVEFVEPQTRLMTLLEPYLLDRQPAQVTAMAQGGQRAAVSNASAAAPKSGPGSRTDRRRHAIRRARAQLAESLGTQPKPPPEEKPPAADPAIAGDAGAGKTDRRLFAVGLLSLLAAAVIVLLDHGQRSQTEDRLLELEAAVDRQVIALASLRAQSSGPSDARSADLEALSARVETLATSFASLETRLDRDAGQVSAAPPPVAAQPANDSAIARAAEESAAPAPAPAPAPADSASDKGPWVINLVSLYDKQAADEFTRKARSQGIRADANPATVKDRQVWRIQVSGFTSRDAASAYAETSKQKLGLNSVWIFEK